MKKTYFGFVGMTAAVSLALAGCSAGAGTSAPSSAAAVQTDEAAQADGAAQTGAAAQADISGAKSSDAVREGNGAEGNGKAPEDIQGELMVYTSSGDDYMTDISKMFQEKYPNIDFQYFRSGTEEVVSKMMTEAKSSKIQCDVIMLADTPTFEKFKEDGLLEAYDYPEIDKLYPDFVDKDHMYYGTAIASTGIIYNTNLVSEAPESFTVFTDGVNKGKCVMPSPLYSGTAAYNLSLYTKLDNLGWEFYEQMKENDMQVVNGNGGVIKAVATGERTYGMCLDTDTLSAMNDGSPLAFVYPREGCSSICDPIAIMKDAPNSDMARLFVDFMLSREVREFAAQNYYKTAPRTDVAVPQGALSVEDRKMLYIDPRDLLGTKEADKQKFDVMFNQ